MPGSVAGVACFVSLFRALLVLTGSNRARGALPDQPTRHVRCAVLRTSRSHALRNVEVQCFLHLMLERRPGGWRVQAWRCYQFRAGPMTGHALAVAGQRSTRPYGHKVPAKFWVVLWLVRAWSNIFS